jgi:hypothetical protein
MPAHSKIKERIVKEARGLKIIQNEYSSVVDLIQKHLEAYKKSKGTPSEKQHIQQLKMLGDKKKKLAAELDAKVSGMYKDAELKVDEMNATGNVQGYGTPHAFGKPGDEKKKAKKAADMVGYSVVNEAKQYKKGDKLKIKLPNGKKFDVVFDMYSRTKGVALGKFKDGSGEYTIKPFNLDTIVESIKESHFKIGDKVKMSHGGVGIIKSLDKEDGADDEKYYGVELPNGEIHKHSPNELVAINENRWLELKRDESTAQSKIGKGISNINKQLAEMERFLNWYGKIKNESGVDNKSYWKRTNSHIYSIKERLLKLDQKIRQISE